MPANVMAPRVARNAVADALGGRVSKEVVDQIRLLTSEIVTNSVRHGRLGDDDWVGVRLQMSEASVHVEVTDTGIGFAPRPVEPPKAAAESGWGLVLVDQLADRWGTLQNHPNRTWFEVDLANHQAWASPDVGYRRR